MLQFDLRTMFLLQVTRDEVKEETEPIKWRTEPHCATKWTLYVHINHVFCWRTGE